MFLSIYSQVVQTRGKVQGCMHLTPKCESLNLFMRTPEYFSALLYITYSSTRMTSVRTTIDIYIYTYKELGLLHSPYSLQ